MVRQLLRDEPAFRTMIARCDTIVRRLGDWSLLDELTADESRSRMEVTAISQPCIFAVQVALAELWASWGVRPDILVGHSVGEVAAAYLAGVFSLEDAVRVIYHRGRCMELAPERGRMLAAGVSPDDAANILAPYGDRIALAAVNGPSSVTLSGESGPLEEIAGRLEARGVFCRFLRVRYAFHSARWTRSATDCSPRWTASGRGRPSCPWSPPSPAGRSTGPSSARNTGGTTSAGRSGSPTGSIASSISAATRRSS